MCRCDISVELTLVARSIRLVRLVQLFFRINGNIIMSIGLVHLSELLLPVFSIGNWNWKDV